MAVCSQDRALMADLMGAALRGDTATVRKLWIDKEVNVNFHDSFGETLLMSAAWSGTAELAEFLIEEGADVNAQDKSGGTALMRAALNGNMEFVTVLANNKKTKLNTQDKSNKTALDYAVEGKHEDVAEVLNVGGARPGFQHIKKRASHRTEDAALLRT